MPGDPKHILVAEDNPALLHVVRFTLEKAGFQVAVARNGRQAWEFLEEQCYDLVVTDQQMPEMTGLDLCARMRQTARHAQTPVVFLTAKGLELDSVRLKEELGVVALFPKPFSPRRLVRAIEDHFGSALTTSPS